MADDTQHDTQRDTQPTTDRHVQSGTGGGTHRATQGDALRDTDREQQLMRPDGHRYEAPESDTERSSKGYAYAALGLLVVLLLVLMATGAVPVFPR